MCLIGALSLCCFCLVLLSGSVHLGAYTSIPRVCPSGGLVIVALLVWVTMSAPEPTGLCGSRVLLTICVSPLHVWPPCPPGGVRLLFLILSLLGRYWGISLESECSFLHAHAHACVYPCPSLRAGVFVGRSVCLWRFVRVCVATYFSLCLPICTLVLQWACLTGAQVDLCPAGLWRGGGIVHKQLFIPPSCVLAAGGRQHHLEAPAFS